MPAWFPVRHQNQTRRIRSKLLTIKVERETGVEPATSSLGSWHSTTELLPLRIIESIRVLRCTRRRTLSIYQTATAWNWLFPIAGSLPPDQFRPTTVGRSTWGTTTATLSISGATAVGTSGATPSPLATVAIFSYLPITLRT